MIMGADRLTGDSTDHASQLVTLVPAAYPFYQMFHRMFYPASHRMFYPVSHRMFYPASHRMFYPYRLADSLTEMANVSPVRQR